MKKVQSKLTKSERRQIKYRRKLLGWVLLLGAFLLLIQGILCYNRFQVKWLEGRYSDVILANSGEIILAVENATGKAGALNREGEVVIPFTSDTFNPWDGSLITTGLINEGKLFWIISDNKVGIVNDKSEEIIPQKYGYLRKSHEDQFIAGTGQLGEVIGVEGAYTHKKFGLITTSGETLIPLEYDALTEEDDGKYVGRIEEDKRTIIRTFYASGQIEREEIQEKEVPQTEPEVDSTEETPPEEPAQEEVLIEEEHLAMAEGEAVGEDTGVEDYEGGMSLEVVNYYNQSGDVQVHLEGTKCTLEKVTGQILVTFEGEYNQETMPFFDKEGQIVIDSKENFYRIYNAGTGVLLCDVAQENQCLMGTELLAYESEDEYIVKKFDNTQLFQAFKGEGDQFLNSPQSQARFLFANSYFVYQGDQGRTLVTNNGIVIAKDLDSIIYNDENNSKDNPRSQIFICEKDGKYAAFNATGDKILDFFYENIEFFTGHKDALRVTVQRGKVGIVDYNGEAIIPLEYDSVGYGDYIEEVTSDSLVEYELLGATTERYYGKTGHSIYYLDDHGRREEDVIYVRMEENHRDFNDFILLNTAVESPRKYTTVGDLPIMDNSYGSDLFFRRSEIHTKLEKDRILFLLIDGNSQKLGIHEYRFGDFTLMGYQHIIWSVWLVLSRLFGVLLVIFLWTFVPYETILKRLGFENKGRRPRQGGGTS